MSENELSLLNLLPRLLVILSSVTSDIVVISERTDVMLCERVIRRFPHSNVMSEVTELTLRLLSNVIHDAWLRVWGGL